MIRADILNFENASHHHKTNNILNSLENNDINDNADRAFSSRLKHKCHPSAVEDTEQLVGLLKAVVAENEFELLPLIDQELKAGYDCLDLPIADIMRQRISGKSSVGQCEDAFFVGDIGELVRQYIRWTTNLPRIEPFYAIKCNTDPVVLKTLAALNTGFDCASAAELATVLELGVSPEAIIYANPCKQASYLRYASSKDIRKMTFDNAEELFKIKTHFPNAELVLRIITDDSRSVCKFSTKFGAPLHSTKGLLATAKSLDLNVIGVSFHVGSGCFDAMSFRDAVVAARRVFDEGSEVGYDFKLLDVGGGFPGNHDIAISFEEIAVVLREAVDELFPPHIRVIAEPGRFFVASVFTLAVNVIARRSVPAPSDEDDSYMYYVNDGVYGSFNCILFDHAMVEPRVLLRGDHFLFNSDIDSQDQRACTVWGPTCDSMDCITKTGSLPVLDVGDWIYFDNVGAYTMAAASTFNGFPKSAVLYTSTLSH
eukprot:Partr_v1_DN28630_c0_g1_i2_m50063 putative ornithine decarboxylase